MASTISNYEQALAFLFHRINYERTPATRSGKRAFKLSRMADLLKRLGNPHLDLPVLHVAGTKGKGSTAAMLASVLAASGYRTGLYSSPHLYRLEERMTIDGRQPSPEQVVELVQGLASQTAPSVCGEEPGPTFFELTTAMAFSYFHQQAVDIAVVEVGLGGRLDSTNVCHPVVSIITSISRDHTRQLGSRLADIAREKAGIIKPGVPVVSGALADPARRVIESICDERNAPLWQLGRDFHYQYHPVLASAKSGEGSSPEGVRSPGGSEDECLGFPSRASFDAQTPASHASALPMPLWGEHQGANGSVALAALDRLRLQGWEVPDSAVREGLRRLCWPARFELLCRRPDVIIDSAHNDASAESVVETLSRSFPAKRKTLIFGATREKDVRAMLRRLLPVFDHVIVTRYQNNPRGVAPGELTTVIREVSGKVPTVFEQPRDAWEAVREQSTGEDLICVTGSFFLAAEMRQLVLNHPARSAVFYRQPSKPATALTV